ncbi:MAG: hypothetical protein RR448_07745 [Niameybacter sp.]|uniref:hypothetical protein n=1 Tax=Niameybacter sp. TaxID=2033640 RepID=UPI002FC9285E
MKQWESPQLKELGVERTETKMDVVVGIPSPFDNSSSSSPNPSGEGDSSESSNDGERR